MPTSPAPDAGPAMCPGVAVLGGGGGSGGGDGSGKGGAGGAGGGGGGSGKGAGGDGKNADGAPDPNKYPECGSASHPVDVVTGRAYTHPLIDLSLPGPLPLVVSRVYSSKMHERDVGLGFGWAHTLGWEIDVRRREVVVWNDQGIAIRFEQTIEPGQEVIGPWGFLLRRDEKGFWLDADDGVFRRFEPASENGRRFRLSSIEDRNGNRIALRYEGGRLAEIVDSAGRVVRVKTTREGRIASLEAQNAIAQGQWVAFATYIYDDAGNLTKVTDADGFTASYAYDDEHQLTADTDRTGLCFHFVYDREGRCVESWGDYPADDGSSPGKPGSASKSTKRDPSLIDELPKQLADGETRAKGIHHCRFDYMPGYYSEVADSTMVRRYFGNAHGTLDRRCEGPAIVEASYRADGHILARREADGGITRFERDMRGRLTKVTDPLGRVTSIARDGHGVPVEITDPAGGVTKLERDERGNLVLAVDATGGVTTWRYDKRGLVTEHVSPTRVRTAYSYDAHGNLVSMTQPNGGVWRFIYDALGRRISMVDPLGAETRYSYSARGNLVAVRDALGGVTRYSYDGEGHLVRVIDPMGHTTQFVWGGYHKLCERRDANGNVVRLRYNLEGELCEVHNEHGEIHRLLYSYSGRLDGETTFDGRKLWYRYDLAGRVTRVTNGAYEHTDLTYDLAGQLVKRELNGYATEEYAYDLRGDLIGVKAPGGELRFERDACGRVLREAQIVGGKEHWVAIAYDPAGERIGRKTSLGHVEAVTRGALGERAHTLLDGSHWVEHQVDLLGRETARALPGGGWLQSAFDALGRVVRRRAGMTAAAEALGRPGEPEWVGRRPERVSVDMAYRYDPAGELVESWDQARGRTQYAYDPIGQLLAVVPEKARSELFRYDAAGNLYEAGEGAEEREYGRGNRLLRKGEWTYAWDQDGRLSEKRRPGAATGQDEVWRYRWDPAGLLKEVERPDGMLVTFTYDPFARRLSKRVTRRGATKFDRVFVSETRFVWDGDVLVHEIEARARQGGDPAVEERTYWFEDDGFAPVAHRERRVDNWGSEADGWFHYVNDPIGTPERLVAADGLVACELKRKAWGEAEIVGEKAGTKIRFQGQYDDEETGLRYNRFRWYEASIARFLSPDPLGIDGALNTYYYGINPFGWIDPYGEIFARKYSRYEVRRMLNQSEGRIPVPGNPPGHAQGFHGSISDPALQARADADGARRSANRTCEQQARATFTALNSPQGQTALGQLDANPGKSFVIFTAPVASTARVATPGGAGPVDRASNSMFVKVFRPPSGSGLPHIQTSYPKS